MHSPEFRPEFVPAGFSWLSIGTSSTHTVAEEFVDIDMETFANVYGQGEIGNPGGTAFTVAGDVARRLAESPLATVSNQLQVGQVWPGKHRIQTLRTEQHGPAWSSWWLADPEGLATTWEEFRQLAGAAGLEAGAASATRA